MVEHESRVSAIQPPLPSWTAGRHSRIVGIPKGARKITRSRHHEAGKHQVSAGDAFQRPKIGTVLFPCLLKASQRVFVADAVVLVPVVPASADKNFRLRYLEAVTEPGLAVDPGSVLAKNLFDLTDGDSDSVFRNVDAIPCVANHLLIVHHASRVLDQNFERTKSSRPKFDFNTVPKKPRSGQVYAETAPRQSVRLPRARRFRPPKFDRSWTAKHREFDRSLSCSGRILS